MTVQNVQAGSKRLKRFEQFPLNLRNVLNDLNGLNILNEQANERFFRAQTSPRCFAANTVDTERSRGTLGGDLGFDGFRRADLDFRSDPRGAGARRTGGLGDYVRDMFLSARCGSKRRGFNGAGCRTFKSF